MSILSLVVFVAVFAGLVLIHEFGHFVVARLCNIEVEEFGIGLPPRVKTLFKWRGTEFTLNALPLGGFVRPKGENNPEVADGLAAASPWKRLAVLSAGPIMNLLVGILAYTLVFAQTGIPNPKIVTVNTVGKDSPAEQAGIQANDIILSYNGKTIDNIDQLRSLIRGNLDKPNEIVVKRDGKQLTLSVTPLSTRSAEVGAMGVELTNEMEPANIGSAITYGVTATGGHVYSLLTLPGRLITGTASSGEGRLIGLKGIFDITNQAVSRDIQTRQTPPADSSTSQSVPTNYTLALIASLTISLGIFNLFPIPALDGGRILFLLPELILRRRVPANVENAIHGISFMLLIILMLYINVMDFIRPLNFTLP
jgi:regulator of sigma E protease